MAMQKSRSPRLAEVETYVIADFTPDVEVAFSAEGVPPAMGRRLVLGEEWVYLRREVLVPLSADDVDAPQLKT